MGCALTFGAGCSGDSFVVGEPGAPGGAGGSSTSGAGGGIGGGGTGGTSSGAAGGGGAVATGGSAGAPQASGECPTAEPSAGAACRAAGLKCSYGTSARPSCRDRYQCTSGRWIVLTEGGCSNDSSCPDDPPASSSVCTGLDQECDYGQAGIFCRCLCPDALCPQQRWLCSDSTSGSCADVVPNEGTDCAGEEGRVCDYGSCRLEDAVVARCSEGLWRWEPASCG